MVRSPEPSRQSPWRRPPMVVILVVLLRALVYASVVVLTTALLVRGYDVPTVVAFTGAVVTSAVAAGVRLTRGVLAAAD